VRAGSISARIHPGLRAGVAAAGLAALTAREVGWGATAVVVAVGAAAVLMPDDGAAPRSDRRVWMAAVVLGTAAFVAVSVLVSTVTLPATITAAVASTIAAVAEEAFFRRFLYGWLSRWGPAVAILGSAVAFAAVHAPLYGVGALPIDLGAGLLLGWQRWATGTWSAPAVTHVAANLLILG
jgi:membrane protease YdiL (CAAX protease family)